jgi:hypothetical protein
MDRGPEVLAKTGNAPRPPSQVPRYGSRPKGGNLPGMPAEDLNGLLRELTGLLWQLRDCEGLWVQRLRDAYQAIGDDGILPSEATQIPPFTPSVGAFPFESMPLESVSDVHPPPINGTFPFESIQFEPVSRAVDSAQIEWSTAPQKAVTASAPDGLTSPERDSWQVVHTASPAGKRNYDFFAELDDKLASLQNGELASPELTDSS